MDNKSFKATMKKLFPKTEPQSQALGPLPEDDFGRTEFTYAILLHQTQDALELLKHYDNVNHKDHAGCSDLFFATQACEVEVLRELLKRGSDVKLDGRSLLCSAMYSAQTHSYDRAFEMVKLLLDAGADPDERDGEVRPSARQNAKYLAPGPIADYLKNWSK